MELLCVSDDIKLLVQIIILASFTRHSPSPILYIRKLRLGNIEFWPRSHATTDKARARDLGLSYPEGIMEYFQPNWVTWFYLHSSWVFCLHEAVPFTVCLSETKYQWALNSMWKGGGVVACFTGFDTKDALIPQWLFTYLFSMYFRCVRNVLDKARGEAVTAVLIDWELLSHPNMGKGANSRGS